MSPPLLDQPPVVPWATWYNNLPYTLTQGMHVLFAGPTQSGKTTLCRMVCRWRQCVVVLGTKPKDPSLDDYVEDGYLRIDHWPPTRSEIRKAADSEGAIRIIVWPKIVTIADLKKWIPLFRKVLESVFAEGYWTIVIDEGLWMADPKGLNLGGHMSSIAYASASSSVSMYLLVQRPANVPPITWTSVSQAMLFHMGRVDDVRDLASLGTYDPRAAASAVQHLEGRRFLDLPVRAQASWGISEVEL